MDTALQRIRVDALAISEVGHHVNAVDGDHVAGFHVVPIDFRQCRNFGYLVEISLAAFPQFLRRAMRFCF